MWVPFPPFVPSVYHPCFLLCIDQICVDWVHFFLFSFCFLQNMQKLAPFLCAFPLLFAHPDSDSWHLSEMALPGLQWAPSDPSARWGLSALASLQSLSPFTQRISPLAPWLCHSEVFQLFFAFSWVLCGSCSLCWPEFTQIQARIQDVHQDAWPASSRL